MKRLFAAMLTALMLLPAQTHAADTQPGHTDKVILKMNDLPKGKWAYALHENYSHHSQSQLSVYPLVHDIDLTTGRGSYLAAMVYFTGTASGCINVSPGWPAGRTANTPVWLPAGVGEKEVGVAKAEGYSLSFCRGHYYVTLIDVDPIHKPNPAIVAGYARLMDSRIKRFG